MTARQLLKAMQDYLAKFRSNIQDQVNQIEQLFMEMDDSMINNDKECNELSNKDDIDLEEYRRKKEELAQTTILNDASLRLAINLLTKK